MNQTQQIHYGLKEFLAGLFVGLIVGFVLAIILLL